MNQNAPKERLPDDFDPGPLPDETWDGQLHQMLALSTNPAHKAPCRHPRWEKDCRCKEQKQHPD